MDLAGYVINAVVVEGHGVTEVARAHGVSRSWLYELLARHRERGAQGLTAQSRRPRASPTRLSAAIEEEIVAMRKALTDEGLDAGAHTIHYHLLCRYRRRRHLVPSVATIWRVLSRRGFVTPQPHKRPKSSFIRFAAELPNECWQADTTHWALADGTDVEILNVIDDHSRLLVASRAFVTTKAADVVATFHQAAASNGLPASMLTDNGAIFTAQARNGRCAMENELAALGVVYKHSRPYHPQTCGKVERFHQTLKKHLKKKRRPTTVAALQRLLDRFREYYNNVRPHRALGRRTPAQAFGARAKAVPTVPTVAEGHHRVRRDRVDKTGTVTLRYRSKLLHIGIGRAHVGTPVLVLVADRDVRVITETGELLRHLTIDPTKNYQGRGRP
ncbi:MAG TPA: IS481 family transposase [Pseudonocardiaceae bacterium]|jgi:transposase InsO family protein|nr:IS481 family transposase [Pseudonocardiaceae bacterium]